MDSNISRLFARFAVIGRIGLERHEPQPHHTAGVVTRRARGGEGGCCQIAKVCPTHPGRNGGLRREAKMSHERSRPVPLERDLTESSKILGTQRSVFLIASGIQLGACLFLDVKVTLGPGFPYTGIPYTTRSSRQPGPYNEYAAAAEPNSAVPREACSTMLVTHSRNW